MSIRLNKYENLWDTSLTWFTCLLYNSLLPYKHVFILFFSAQSFSSEDDTEKIKQLLKSPAKAKSSNVNSASLWWDKDSVDDGVGKGNLNKDNSNLKKPLYAVNVCHFSDFVMNIKLWLVGCETSSSCIAVKFFPGGLNFITGSPLGKRLNHLWRNPCAW